MDVSDIEQLIELMRRSGVMHLSLEQPSYKIAITRGAEGAAVVPPAAVVTSPAAVSAPPVVSPVAMAPAAVRVDSPVVGRVRIAGAERGGRLPAVGDRVARGQVLAVVEAMKVPNDVPSPLAGTVSAVLVEDGSPVEYGQTLFLLLPEEGGETDEDETPVGLA